MIVNSERQVVVDRLRGFALLGIVNAPFILTSSVGWSAADTVSAADLAAQVVVWVFFQAKSYVLFAFLFGYSLTILLSSPRAAGRQRRVYLQRLAGLIVLGVGHAVLLFPGDTDCSPGWTSMTTAGAGSGPGPGRWGCRSSWCRRCWRWRPGRVRASNTSAWPCSISRPRSCRRPSSRRSRCCLAGAWPGSSSPTAG
jgi:hypothetical protein